MMDSGYIKNYRSLMSKGYYKKSEYVHLWGHLLMKAAYQETEFIFNGNIEILKPGQLITGRKILCAETGIAETTIERILKVFENEHQIGQQKNNKFRIITIINWDKYQGDGQQNEQQTDSQRTASGQPADTYKKVKKLRIRSSTLPEFFFDFSERKWTGISEQDIDGWKTAYPACDIQIELAGMGEWLLANPEKKKSNYRRFVTNWLKRTQDKGGTRQTQQKTTSKWFPTVPDSERMR